MRKDFKKLLCEEPRRKGWQTKNKKSLNKRKGYKKRYQWGTKGDYDEWSLPRIEPMCGKRGRGDKDFGEHLQPLVRYLRTNVGRKWDDIFSEIRQQCPNDNAVNAHIYQHLWGYVERKPYYIDGVPHRNPGDWFGSPYPISDHGRDNTFYVDMNGILRRAPRRESYRQRQRRADEKRQKNSDVRELDGVYYVRKNGVWFETKLVPLPKPHKRIETKESRWRGTYTVEVIYYPDFVDAFLGGYASNEYGTSPSHRLANLCKKTYGRKVYCSQLRQLNSRELRRLGLKD